MNVKEISLDYVAAVTSQNIVAVIGEKIGKDNKKIAAKDTENLITKTLGILQSQGIYAMYLFLLSRSGDKTNSRNMNAEQRIACEITAQLWNELSQEPAKAILKEGFTPRKWDNVNNDKENILSSIAGLLTQLDTVFLLRDLYEQTLIYARFGAKAKAKEEEK